MEQKGCLEETVLAVQSPEGAVMLAEMDVGLCLTKVKSPTSATNVDEVIGIPVHSSTTRSPTRLECFDAWCARNATTTCWL